MTYRWLICSYGNTNSTTGLRGAAGCRPSQLVLLRFLLCRIGYEQSSQNKKYGNLLSFLEQILWIDPIYCGYFLMNNHEVYYSKSEDKHGIQSTCKEKKISD